MEEPADRPFRRALLDIASVGPGMAVLGVSFGLLVVSSGLSWWWAPLFSGLIYAGSLEFLLIPLTMVGTPLATIAVTTLLVNGRHLFYGLSFPLDRIRGRTARAYSVFALVDEAYALLTTDREPMGHRRILTTQVLMHACWAGGSLAGALGGSSLGIRIPALDFVFLGLFLVLALEAARAGRDLTAPALGVAAALVARWITPGQMLLVAMVLLTAALLARHRWSGRRGESGA